MFRRLVKRVLRPRPTVKTEPRPPQRDVKLPFAPEGTRAFVRNPSHVPWCVVQLSGERAKPEKVKWGVIVSLPPHVERLPLVFKSRDEAKAWSDELAQDVDWDVIQRVVEHVDVTRRQDAMAETDKLVRFANKLKLPSGSPEVWRRAHEKGELTNTLELFPQPGCVNDPYVAPSGPTVQLDVMPLSCRSTGTSALYQHLDSQGNATDLLWLGSGDVNCDQLPVGAVYASTT
jgi:hypothetical protein